VLVREPRSGVGRARQVLQQRAERPVGDEHRRGVDHVLAGRAAVDVPGGGPLHALRQRLDERRGRVAGRRRRRADLARVVVRRAARGADRLGVLGGDEARLR
jgi:hypothetical protein